MVISEKLTLVGGLVTTCDEVEDLWMLILQIIKHLLSKSFLIRVKIRNNALVFSTLTVSHMKVAMTLHTDWDGADASSRISLIVLKLAHQPTRNEVVLSTVTLLATDNTNWLLLCLAFAALLTL